MSSLNNDTVSLVPISDETDYQQWSTAMRAFLMLQGLWQQTQGYYPYPTFLKEKDVHDTMTETQKEEKCEA